MGMFFYDMYFIIIMIMLQGGKTHHLHADADAALRTASNRVSGVTTRHISSTVRIFRSEEVKADGHVAIYHLGAPKGGELLED